MNRTLRGSVVAFLALVLALAALVPEGAAQASRVAPPTGKNRPRFTHGEAHDLLTRATRQLRPDTRRLRSRKPVGSGPDTDITMTLRDLYLARPQLTGAERRSADVMLSRSRVFTDGSTDPITVSTPSTKCSANFCVHYRAAPLSEASTPQQVQLTLDTLEHVRAYETSTLGYRTPIADTPSVATTDNPNAKFDVFLGDVARQGLYGYCAPDGAQPETNGQAAAFCVLDNDYARSQYGAAPLNSLRVTAAHEFFHAVQFAYDVAENLWFMEGTATWVEDEVYDSINDNYQYLPSSGIRHPRTSLNTSAGAFPYGSFIFFKYASERHGVSIVRRFWNAAVGSASSLTAVYGVMGAAGWPSFFATFGSWNTLPRHSYSERAGYPSPTWWQKRTLTKRSASTGWRSTNISHLGNAPAFLAPGKALSTHKRLLIEINGPNRSLGTAALLQRRYRNGQVTHTRISVNTSGNARTLVHFNRSSISGLAVILSNTSRSGARHVFKMRASLR